MLIFIRGHSGDISDESDLHGLLPAKILISLLPEYAVAPPIGAMLQLAQARRLCHQNFNYPLTRPQLAVDFFTMA